MQRFELHRELGSGATGTVFEARDRVSGDTVAVKQLFPGAVVPQREVLLARKISHPNVCRVHDFYEEDGEKLISMEYVDGETLKSLMERSGALPIDRCLHIVRQILNGLEAAHQLKIIHRDLQPKNIMILGDDRVKIMDFGNARIVDVSPDLTGSNVAGTPRYVAPEQAIGQVTDQRTDLYSLGAVFYQMITGKKMGRVQPAYVPGAPGYVEAAILRCLDMDPSRRFASISELRDALAGPRLYRPVSPYAAMLAAFLAIVVGVWIASVRMAPELVATVKPGPVPAPAEVKPRPTVAVLFEGPIGDALADALIRGGKYLVVERRSLDATFSKLLPEDKKGIVGAEYMMAGSSEVSEGQIHISAKLIRTETTELVASKGIAGDPADALKLAEELAGRF